MAPVRVDSGSFDRLATPSIIRNSDYACLLVDFLAAHDLSRCRFWFIPCAINSGNLLA
jgi:hypothetical protein